MKKNIIVLLSIFSVLFLTGCNSNKSMLKKMNIDDLPKITGVKLVDKSKNFVSQTTMYLGEKDAFENYAISVHAYLNQNYYDSLGYTSELLQSFFGTGAQYDFYNQANTLDQFMIETEYKITYQFIFSNNNAFWLNESDGTYYLDGASSVILVYFKDYQDNENEKTKYNIAVELYKPLSRNNYAHVNSDIFSSFIFKNTNNLNTKEYLMTLFLEEYNISTLSKEEVKSLLGTDIIEDDNIQYKYGDTNNDMLADKILKIYYENEDYIKHEIITNTEL